ncbi:ABC transporter permease [Aridibaculum aurantiacum]|uniref:ABC transporter permease n=1 Tax=Aridibaculum aurantiacum TaxID=2810307 RepID=UPI001A96A5A2|nr:ABC transporter permease [Aridibaculum aurantiacum]
MNLLVSLRSEMLKTKRTAAFYFTLFGAGVVPFILLLNITFDDDAMDATRNDPLNGIFKLVAEMNALVIFPMFVVLICTLLPQIEFRNNTWKQVLTSPQTKANVFMAKLLNVQLLVVLFLVATHVFTSVVLIASTFIKPDLNLVNQSFNGYVVLVRALNTYVTALAIFGIQFWLGLRLKNFIIPIAIGLACWLAGMLMVLEYKSSFATYFPYSFNVFSISPKHVHLLNQVEWNSFMYAIIFLVLGFLDFRRRRMSGI